jgi:hypothetical protein
MVTEVRTTPSPEELAELREKHDRQWDRLYEAIYAGIAAAGISQDDGRGVSALASLTFSDFVVHEFDDDAAFWCTRLADVLARQPLMVKMLNALELDRDVTDCADDPNGVLGKAINGAIEVLEPVARFMRKDSK